MKRQDLKEIISEVIVRLESSAPATACGVLWADATRAATTKYSVGEEDPTTKYSVGEEDPTTKYSVGEEDPTTRYAIREED